MDNNLLKVMLVDDEENVRNLLKSCIDWNEAGMEISGEASSSREALDLLEEFSPDIIITDIRMPFMDGLEFSSIVAERYPYIKIVVLTAYEEFEYAKKGIKVGISDFLLKPIKRTELKNSLSQLRNKIEAERMNRNEYAKFRKQLQENFSFLKEKFLNDLLQSRYTIDEISDKIQYFRVQSLENHIQVAMVSSEQADSNIGGNEEERVLLDLACMEVIKQYFRDDAEVNIFIDNSRRIVVLNSSPDVDVLLSCEQIKALIINRLKCFVSIGIGNIYNELKSIKKSYKEACEALDYKVVYGKNQVVSFNDINITNRNSDIKIDEINEIGFYVKAGVEEKAIEIVRKIFNDFHIDKNNSIEQIRVLSVNIVTSILNSVTELGLNFDEIFETKILPYNNVLKIDTIPEMKEYLNELLLSVIKSVKSARCRKTNKLFIGIKDYMQDNISDSNLSLSVVANAFFLNSSYLSRIFKQETGQTFVEYMTTIRMEIALRMLKETDLRAYEVAEKIGIPDPNYFGKCFKKYSGLSVFDYRKA
jgi:two-component system, response regulator YesN